MIITIDGFVASGKSTISRGFAIKNNFFHISSGLFYRVYAYELLKKNIDLKNESLVYSIINDLEIQYTNDPITKSPIIKIHEKDISEDIKQENIGFVASQISSYESIRSLVKEKQKNLASLHENIIIDGRDCGVKIFPNANFKFFITALFEIRIKRMEERSNKKITNEMIQKMKQRDINDTKRTFPAYDSLIVETSNLTSEEVIFYLEKIIFENI